MSVRLVVNTSPGPARGATICDLRGQYRGEVMQTRGNCTVVLETSEPLSGRPRPAALV